MKKGIEVSQEKINAVNRFIQDVDLAQNKWMANVIQPFAIAYNSAYNSYADTLARQQQRDDTTAGLAGSLIVIASAVLGGTALTAIFGNHTISNAVREIGVRAVANGAVRHTFRRLSISSSNPLMSFALGRGFEMTMEALHWEARSWAGSQIQWTVPVDAGQNNPLGRFLVLSNAIERMVVLVKEMAMQARDDPRVGDTEAIVQFDMVRRGPLMSPPEPSPYDATTARAIELAMFLNLIMTRDYLSTTWTAATFDMTSTERQPISSAPGSASYPRDQDFGRGNSQQVGAHDLGGVIDRRINELHREFFGGQNLLRTGMFSSLSVAEVASAHRSLERLAQMHTVQPPLPG